jgi:hypothetical protein
MCVVVAVIRYLSLITQLKKKKVELAMKMIFTQLLKVGGGI